MPPLTMEDFFCDTALGYIVRHVSKGKYMRFPEERPNFQLPEIYRRVANDGRPMEEENPPKRSEETQVPSIYTPSRPATANTTVADLSLPSTPRYKKSGEFLKPPSRPENAYIPMENLQLPPDLDRIRTFSDMDRMRPSMDLMRPSTEIPRPSMDLEQAITLPNINKALSQVPMVTADGAILVDWYGTDDQANPQNWTLRRKAFIAFQICFYTTSVYLGSAIYTASEHAVSAAFGVSSTKASLGLALYVLGYGTGPLLFAPLSEIPIIGRNPPYIITYAIFVLISVPTALVNNWSGLMALRFFQGFFGSPCLATGGASMGDVYPPLQVPYLMTAWVAAATVGPSLGPLIAGFSVTAENWHWSLWEILWLAGPIFVILFLCLPETYASNILLRRAQRLRKVTGNPNFKSQSEIDQAKLTVAEVAVDALWRPIQIHALDPAVAFATLYAALTYGIYYSFFEAFPIVYAEKYGFNLGVTGLTFLSIVIGVAIAVVAYCSYLAFFVNPHIMKYGMGEPEQVLVPACVVSVFVPTGLFIFGWTGNGDIHWIVSLIGVAIYSAAVFIVFQCIFLYIPIVYPQYTASLFAGNDFARSSFSVGAILYGRPLFVNLGVGKGISLLGGLTVGCIFGVWALWYWGGTLRKRSRFTVKQE